MRPRILLPLILVCFHAHPLPAQAQALAPSGQPTGKPKAFGSAQPPAPAAPSSERGIPANPPRAVPVSFSKGPDWRFMHPGAHFLGGVNVKSLLESPAIKALPGELARQAPTAGAKLDEIQKFLTVLSDIDYLALSVQERPGTKEADILLLVVGALEGNALRPLLDTMTGKARPRFLGPDRLLIGEPDAVDAAVVRMAGPPLSGAGRRLMLAAQQLRLEYDVWLTGDPSSLPADPSKPGAPAGFAEQLASELLGFSFGLKMSGTPVIQLSLQAASPAAADKMMALYELGKARMLTMPEGQKQWEIVSKGLQTTRAGNEIRFRFVAADGNFALDAATLTRMMGPQLGGLLGQTEQPAPGPQRNTVVIHGLDSGPKEIPLTK